MCTQIKDIRSLYMKKHHCKTGFMAIMCTQVRFCVWHATLLVAVRDTRSLLWTGCEHGYGATDYHTDEC